MTTDIQVQIAANIAALAHHGQFRHDGVTPYIIHPGRVASRLKSESAEIIATAWLHDVLEDTGLTRDELVERGVKPEVAHAVVCLTKMPGEPYENYLRVVKANPIARKVKIADMLDNLSDSPSERQIRKYAKGLLALVD